MMHNPSNLSTARQDNQSGNVLFMILIAIVLIGLLTVALQSTNRSEGSNIDSETLVIRASEVQQYAGELERAIAFIMQNGKSESDIRFAHYNAHADYGDITADSDLTDQVFAREGGGAAYREPPAGINDGSAWEFYGGSHAPGVGRSDRAELMAVLPYVTQDFCDQINTLNNQIGTMGDTGSASGSSSNAGSCVQIGAIGRFDDAQQFYSTINTMDETNTSFAHDANTSAARPALQGCVTCAMDTNAANGAADEMHFYHVIMAR